MASIIEKLEEAERKRLKKDIPDFRSGDTVRVNVRISEGTTQRVQSFEGVCIARKNAGLRSSFTVRKISYGEGVERIFPLHSPMIEGIDLVRRGKVRRAKLYYLRALRGKAARIAERRMPISKKAAKKTAAEASAQKSAKHSAGESSSS